MMERSIPVAVLTYNRSETAIKSIKSIMNDVNIKNLAVFDDGSNHEELAKIVAFCDQYPNIQVYKNKQNMGYQNNLIRALTYLSGLNDDFVFLCESDMLLVKDWSIHVFEAFARSPESIALSVMLHQDQLQYNRSKIFRVRCLTGYDSRFPNTKGRLPFGTQCFNEMPDAQTHIKLSQSTIKFVSNSIGSIIFCKDYLEKIIPYLGELKKFPKQEDAWLGYMCFKVNSYHPHSFMVLDPGLAFTFGENGLHGDMSLNNLRWMGSMFWRHSFLAKLSRQVLYYKYLIQRIKNIGIEYGKKIYSS